MPGGRPKGAPNKVTRDVREAAMKYSTRALQTLATIMGSKKYAEAARVAAARELLNRAHGMPTTHLEANVNLLERLSATEQETLAAALATVARNQGEDAEGTPPTHH